MKWVIGLGLMLFTVGVWFFPEYIPQQLWILAGLTALGLVGAVWLLISVASVTIKILIILAALIAGYQIVLELRISWLVWKAVNYPCEEGCINNDDGKLLNIDIYYNPNNDQ